MDYKILKNAITIQDCYDLISFGQSQYAGLNPDQLYPNRGYPGFTLTSSHSILVRLSEFLLETDFNITYDYEIGSAVNFINAQQGENIGPHIDKPLYEFDENIQILPEYENRECVMSILVGLKGQNIFSIDSDDITLEEKDVIVMRGYTVHELKPIQDAEFYMLSAFYCSNIN